MVSACTPASRPPELAVSVGMPGTESVTCSASSLAPTPMVQPNGELVQAPSLKSVIVGEALVSVSGTSTLVITGRPHASCNCTFTGGEQTPGPKLEGATMISCTAGPHPASVFPASTVPASSCPASTEPASSPAPPSLVPASQ